jgi:hypothetical protein
MIVVPGVALMSSEQHVVTEWTSFQICFPSLESHAEFMGLTFLLHTFSLRDLVFFNLIFRLHDLQSAVSGSNPCKKQTTLKFLR